MGSQSENPARRTTRAREFGAEQRARAGEREQAAADVVDSDSEDAASEGEEEPAAREPTPEPEPAPKKVKKVVKRRVAAAP